MRVLRIGFVSSAAGQLVIQASLLFEGPGSAPAEALGAATVHLFLDRARAVRSGFTLTDENYETIAAICRRLDGLPPAPELAAARVHTMTPAEILRRLDDRFPPAVRKPVRGGTAPLPVRGRRMELGHPRRTGMPSGPAPLAVPGRGRLGNLQEVGPGYVIGPLSRLVNKSLVEFDGRRYRMLVTIRAFVGSTLASEQSAA
ncbi:hypothetical protein ACWEP5_33385 [Nocardia niigatensis]